jgi:hypothetical protein
VNKRQIILESTNRRNDGGWGKNPDGTWILRWPEETDENDLGRLFACLRLSGANIEIKVDSKALIIRDKPKVGE